MTNHVANTFFNQAIKFIHTGERQKASETFQQVVQLNPYNIDAWLWLAALTNDRDQRIFHLNQVLLLDPQNRTALEGLHALNKQHKRFLELQNDTYTSIGKQTIKLQNPFGHIGSQNTSYLPLANGLQFAKRSHGPIKDALAQRRLIRFIKRELRKRTNLKAMSVDFVLEVMKRGDLTWQESIALIEYVADRVKQQADMNDMSVGEVVVFALGFALSLAFSFITGSGYGLFFMIIWPWIFLYTMQTI